MADNLRKVMHRGEQIDEMDERASEHLKIQFSFLIPGNSSRWVGV